MLGSSREYSPDTKYVYLCRDCYFKLTGDSVVLPTIRHPKLCANCNEMKDDIYLGDTLGLEDLK